MNLPKLSATYSSKCASTLLPSNKIKIQSVRSGLTTKAEPPPTWDANRDSGTDSANGGWLRRLVRPLLSHKSKILLTASALLSAFKTRPTQADIKIIAGKTSLAKLGLDFGQLIGLRRSNGVGPIGCHQLTANLRLESSAGKINSKSKVRGSGLTNKAEPPPTNDVNRDSGTAMTNGGWLRRLVRPRRQCSPS